MMMRARVLAIVLTLGAAFAAPVVADDNAPAGSEQSSQALQQRRDKIKQRIRALRAYTLTEQLELDEATAAKLFPALAKYDEELDTLLRARAELQRRLEAAGAQKDTAAVDPLIDQALANQRAIWDAETRRLEQLRTILTPQQTARLLVVLPAMERTLANQLRAAVQSKPTGTGTGTQTGPGASARDGELRANPYRDPARPAAAPAPRPAAKPAVKPKKDKANVKCNPFSEPKSCQ